MKILPLNSADGRRHCEEILRAPERVGGHGKLVDIADTEVEALHARLHDVMEAVGRFAAATDALKKGYRFDDSLAPRLIELMGDAARVLDEELDLLRRIYP